MRMLQCCAARRNHIYYALHPHSIVNPGGDDMTAPLSALFSSANQLSFSVLEELSSIEWGRKAPPGVWMHGG